MINAIDKKYLIIGANGLIGRRLAELLDREGMVWMGTCCNRVREDLISLDITNLQDLERVFEQADPDIIFHCANLGGGVDYCEAHPDHCQAFHLTATQQIGRLCRLKGARLVFISSDYVFSDRNLPAREEDDPQPLNIYGRMKLAAEQWIVSNMADFIITRTTNVYGWDPQTVTPNFIMNIYRTIHHNCIIKVPSYLWGTPTYVSDLAQVIFKLAVSFPSDIYHAVGPEFINRYDWAIRACGILGMDASRVIEVSEPPKNMVSRPLKLSLSTAKIQDLGIILHDVDNGLKLMKADILNESR